MDFPCTTNMFINLYYIIVTTFYISLRSKLAAKREGGKNFPALVNR